jgi:inosine/xanthosine triphosphate pyrophosphatase family protein
MKKLYFSTGNENKFKTARVICKNNGINLEQKDLPIDEIQGEDGLEIIKDKAAKAFALLGEPVVVSDDYWEFLGLNGFPGPYMKSINHWLAPEDMLRLTLPLKNKDVILTQRLAYQDKNTYKVFELQNKGKLIDEIRGISSTANQKLVTLEGDNGLTISEIYDSGIDRSDRKPTRIWKQFAVWYAKEA